MSTGPVRFPPEVDVPDIPDADLAEDMRLAQERQRREYARDLEAIAQLARRRLRTGELATSDGRGGPGVDARALACPVLAEVREDFVAELALLRGCSEAEAGTLVREALLLTGVLAATWSHLFAGVLSVGHARAAVDLLGDAPPEVAVEVQARVLAKAQDTTLPTFRERLRYHLYRVDADAKERRRREALERIGVFVRRVDEGVSELAVQGPTPAVHAAYDMVDALARMRRTDGDICTLGVLRADTAVDLMLRPWDTSRPPVTAQLVVHASARSLRPDGDAAQTQDPGELDGTVVSAAECRDLLHELGFIGLAEPPVGGSILVAFDGPVNGETIAVATRAELRRAAEGARPVSAAGHPGVRADQRAEATHHRARPALPHARLPAPSRPRPLRPRPRGSARRRGTHRLLEPLLPVPAAPPDQDLRPRLVLPAPARRHAGRPHPLGCRPADPSARLVRRPRTRSALARRASPARSAAVLRSSSGYPPVGRLLPGTREERGPCATR